MNIKTKIKVAVGTISTFTLVMGLLVGLATSAVAPSRAEAQMLIQKKYQNYAKFKPTELVELLSSVGFDGQELKYAWAIAMKESHGNALDYNGNVKTGDHSYGLFQINMLGSMGADRRAQFGLAYNAQLLNPVENAKIAYHMSNHGKNWSAWKGTNNSVVRDWLTKYPYKAHQQATKAKAKAKAKAKHLAVNTRKVKVVAKAKPTQKQ